MMKIGKHLMASGLALALAFSLGFMASTAYAGEGKKAPIDPEKCAERCEKAADKMETLCLEKGGSETDCAAKKQTMLDKCAAKCANPPTRPGKP